MGARPPSWLRRSLRDKKKRGGGQKRKKKRKKGEGAKRGGKKEGTKKRNGQKSLSFLFIFDRLEVDQPALHITIKGKGTQNIKSLTLFVVKDQTKIYCE